MKLYWCRTCGRDGRNFGDGLGPVLLRRRGVDVDWAPPAEAELVTAGSVLSKFPAWWRGTVLGTGFIQARMTATLSRARVLAVRGVLTRDAAGLPPSTFLADPGILVGELLPSGWSAPADRYTAVVPHYVDHELFMRHPGAVFVDILDRPDKVVSAIAGAGLVYTSSLHALIAADALGIPHVLELGPTIGGLHKFRDYASAFEELVEPGEIRLTDRGAMAERQREIRRLFDAVAEEATAVAVTDHREPAMAASPGVTAPRPDAR